MTNKLSEPKCKRPSKRKKGSVKSSVACKFKISRILKDIEEAQTYGIHLHEISLTELYSYLNDARKQKAVFDKKNQKGRFRYDPIEDEQPPDTDGLSELALSVARRKPRL